VTRRTPPGGRGSGDSLGGGFDPKGNGSGSGDGGHDDPLEAPWSTFPAHIQAAFSEASEKFLSSPRFVCKHVHRGSEAPLVCAEHPKLGGMCAEKCFPRHLERHSEDSEFTCNECGGISDTICGLVLQMECKGLPVRLTNGTRSLAFGPFYLGGVGVCPDCYRKAVAA
jgi:hypothetical protein